MTAAERKRVAESLRKLTEEWFDPSWQNETLRLAADYLDPPEPAGGTVWVRIAVVAQTATKWSAYGHCADDDDRCRAVAEEGLWMTDGGTPSRFTWVEASAPLPDPPAVVEGRTVEP